MTNTPPRGRPNLPLGTTVPAPVAPTDNPAMAPAQRGRVNLDGLRANRPRGGGDPPPMPLLAPMPPGVAPPMSPADQAALAARGSVHAQAQALGLGGHSRAQALQPGSGGAPTALTTIMQPAPQQFADVPITREAVLRVLSADDQLHPNAQRDPNYIQGIGAGLAQSQPELALQYGIVRRGVFITPMELQAQITGRPAPNSVPSVRLSDASRSGLEMLQRIHQDHNAATAGTAQTQAAQAPTATAAEAPTSAAGAEEDNGLQTEESDDTATDENILRLVGMTASDMLANTEQRKIVEARLRPILLEDLLLQDSVVQVVPVIPGKYELAFRSLTGMAWEAIEHWVWVQAREIKASQGYADDKLTMARAVVGLERINGVLMPSAWKNPADPGDGIDLVKLGEKYNYVIRKNVHMLASISVQHQWFEQRVRALWRAQNIKNG